MQIGNYQDPDKKGDEPIVDKREEQEATPAKRMVDGIQSNLEKSVKQRESAADKAVSWEERLAEKDISIDEAHAIIDDLLTKGYYEETVPLTKRKTVNLRSRTQYDYQRYMRALEIVSPRFNDEMQELAMRYFLAASIARFGDTVFDFPDPHKVTKAELDKAFEVRLEWIEAQPGHLIYLLSQKLNAFDEKIALIFSEGVIENF